MNNSRTRERTRETPDAPVHSAGPENLHVLHTPLCDLLGYINRIMLGKLVYTYFIREKTFANNSEEKRGVSATCEAGYD